MDLESTDVEKRTFGVARKGYDQAEVDTFLAKVSQAMARIDERRTIAEVRCEQLEREIHEVRTRAETTIQETVAARARLIEASGRSQSATGVAPVASSSAQATIEAQRIIEQAEVRAMGLQAEAEAVLEGALSTSAKISTDRDELLSTVGAERQGLIAAATSEAEEIRSKARQDAESDRAKAALRVAEAREQAKAEAELVAGNAEMQASAMISRAERQRDDLLEQIERSRSDMSSAIDHADADRSMAPEVAKVDEITDEIEISEDDTAWPADDVEDARPEPEQLTDELDRITVDLREPTPDEELEPGVRVARPSRYRSRSANLPHLGDDAASVIGSMDALRSKD